MARYQVPALEFQDSTGQTFFFQITTNTYAEAQKSLEAMTGTLRLRTLFRLGLINGSEDQKTLTLADAGDILDDLGIVKANELIGKTRFGKNLEEAVADGEAKGKAAAEKALAEAGGQG